MDKFAAENDEKNGPNWKTIGTLFYTINQKDDQEVDLEETETNPTVVVPSGGVEIIMDLREWLKSPWDVV